MTQGKWSVANTQAGKWKVVDNNGFSILNTPNYGKEAEANATIAAEIPTMLDMLKRIRQDFSNAAPSDDEWMGKHLNELTEFFDKLNAKQTTQ